MNNIIRNKLKKSVIADIYHRTPLSKRGRQTREIMRGNKDLIAPFRKAFWELHAYNPDGAAEFVKSYRADNVSFRGHFLRPGNAGQTVQELPAFAPIPEGELILICCVKDEAERVKAQVAYYRKLGVRHFAYIDNMSTDGTRQWLLEQDDVILFCCDEYFLPVRRVAWRKKVMDTLGYNRWYFVLDADEFFCYPGAPQIPIAEYIAYLSAQGYRSAFAPLVDMYSDKALFSETDDADFIDEYRYFDTDTYVQMRSYHSRRVKGGPRARVFAGGDTGKYSAWELTKHPLIYATQDIISSCHTNYPYSRNKTGKKPVAFLLHYKGLSSDVSKYKNIEKEREAFAKGIAGGVTDYVVMMDAFEKNPQLSYYREGSQRLDSSMDLLKIDIGDKKFFEGLLSAGGLSPDTQGNTK